MLEALLRVPVACPKCTQEQLLELAADTVAEALANGAAILLFVNCHRAAWKASLVEREQLKEYLEAAMLSRQMSDLEKRRRGHLIIDTNGSHDRTRAQVRQFLRATAGLERRKDHHA